MLDGTETRSSKFDKGVLGLIVLIAVGVLCPLLAAPSIPLVDPDEGLHASIAQEMVESGDWTVPRLLGEPFLDKPILYFWAIALSLKLFGMSEAAVRLPGLLFGALGTATTAAIAWRLFGRRTGLIAGLFYGSMIVPLALVQLPAHDVALVPWVNLALLCFWQSDRCNLERKSLGWAALAGVALGLAIMTKGLAGVALVGLTYGSYLIVARRLRFIHCLRAVIALTVAAVVGGSWFLALEHANPGYLRYYFFERHVLGFLTKSQPHGGAPWWYYAPIVIIGGLPWFAYMPALVQDAVARWRSKTPPVADDRGNRPIVFAACWFIGCTLFLTVSKSKLVTYIWPVFPAVAILAAIVWARQIEGVLTEKARRMIATIVWSTCLMGPLSLPATIAVTQIALPTRISLLAWTVAVAVGLTSLLPLLAWRRGNMEWTLGLATTTVCCQLATVMFIVFPQVALALSGRDLAEYFNRTRELPPRIEVAQERVGSVIFYLAPDLRAQLQPGQVMNQDIDDPLPNPSRGAKELVAIPERHLHTAVQDYNLAPLAYEQAGRFRLYRRSDMEPQALTCRVDDSQRR